MMNSDLISANFKKELFENILPFWMNVAPDPEYGGFYGGVTNTHEIHNEVPRTAVSCTRFLWTFSHAYMFDKNPEYLKIADLAFNYLKSAFWDKKFGGLYWSVDKHGNPVQDRKHHYAQAFGIYGLSEYYRATGKEESLQTALEIFELLEKHAYEQKYGGYLEGSARDWSALADMRLGENDMNCQKSMNTMLHIMEAYTNLIQVRDDEKVGERLLDTIEIFQKQIISSTHHFNLYFNADWSPLSDHISYGHDIEGSWLLDEAAAVIGDNSLKTSISKNVNELASSVLEEGIRADKAIIQEASPRGITNPNIEWWPQTEAVIGFYNAYQISGVDRFKDATKDSWNYINERLIDRERGGWFKRLLPNGSVNNESLKAGPWEGPYHEARMCFEMIRRLPDQIER